MDTEYAMPHALGPEKALISMMLRNNLVQYPRFVDAGMTIDMFYLGSHIKVGSIIAEYTNNNESIEMISLVQSLIEKRVLDDLGGAAAVTELFGYAINDAQFDRFCEIVKCKHICRKMIELSLKIQNQAPESKEDVQGLIGETEVGVSELSSLFHPKSTSSVKGAITKVLHQFQEMITCDNPKSLFGITTGFDRMDNFTLGLRPQNVFIIGARPSVGKAQPLWVKVLTPKGFVRMGEIKTGDMVIGLDGRPTEVLGVFPQGELEVFEVKMSDGSITHACGDHLWLTETRNERRSKNSGASVKTTEQIAKTINRPDGGTRNHSIPNHAPVNFSEELSYELPIHPWLLGALIGDGKLKESSISFHKPEKDIQDKVISLLPESDSYTIIEGGLRIVRKVQCKKKSETKLAITRLGLDVNSHEKFIPKEYLFSSIENRFELLRGLIDTDGSVVNGKSIEYSTSSEQLADDFLFLARSLGLQCSISNRIPKYTYNDSLLDGKRSWRIFFAADDRLFSSEKHKSRIKSTNRREHRSIISIKPIGYDECQCIKVSASDSLYITDDFIPTHNTAFMNNITNNVCVQQQKPTLVFSCEMSKEAIISRMIYSLARMPFHKLTNRSGQRYIPSKEELIRMREAALKINAAPLYIEDKGGITIEDLKTTARRHKRQFGIKCIMIDYLQLIRCYNKMAQSSKNAEVTEVSAQLKALAKELDIPIICLSQLNRNAASSKRPRMSELRDSGSIEQDADIIGLLHRYDYEGNTERKGEAEINITKNREGPTGIIELEWHAEITQFIERPIHTQ